MLNGASKAEPKYRVLLIAEAANPEWASVALIEGWLSRALAEVKLMFILAVTQVRNRNAMVRAGLIEGRDFSAIDNERYAKPLHKISTKLGVGGPFGHTMGTALNSLAYYSFESELWRQFGNRFVAREFDLVHRITPLTPTSQSIIAKRLAALAIPFVIGPLNGGAPWPRSFVKRQHAEREWLSHVRGLYKLMPAYRSTYRYSAAVIAGSQHTLRQLPRSVAGKSVHPGELR